MHWLLQENLGTEERQKPYIDALNYLKDHHNITWSFVKLIPFADTVEPDNDYSNQEVFALGSTSLMRVAKLKGWYPGVIYNENFRFEKWLEHYGKNNLLNGDAIVSRFEDAKILEPNAFVRPCEDLKAFDGMLIDSDVLTQWQKDISNGEKSTRAIQLNSDTMIIVSPIKIIYREWRFFVVNKTVITGSQYKNMYGKCLSTDIDNDVIEFVKSMVIIWQPADCFVIDVADTPDGLKIIEINCFNVSGIYACNAKMACLAADRFYSGIIYDQISNQQLKTL